MQLPFLSRSSHEAILAETCRRVQVLEEQVAYLRSLEGAHREAQTSLLTAQWERVVEERAATEGRKRGMPQERPSGPEPPMDLAEIDPADNEALAFIVRREMTPGSRMTATSMMRAMERLREQVVEAHRVRESRAATPLRVYAAEPPEAIAGRIAQAEASGRQAALAREA